MKRIVIGWLALAALGAPAAAQNNVRLVSDSTTGTIAANGQSVVLRTTGVGGFGSVKVQTLDSYSGTWEVQCAVNGNNFDADAELTLKPVDSTTTATSVTDTVGIWDVLNASGCAAIRVIATAGFAASDTAVVISATQSGGSNGSSGSSGPTDTDDGSIAGSQSVGIQAGMAYVWNGSAWVRAATGSGVTGSDVPRVDVATDGQAASDLADAASHLATLAANPSVDGTHDNPVPASGPLVVLEAKDFDGSALPNTVSAEGDAVRGAGSLSGVAYSMLVNENGSKELGKLEDDAHATADYGMPIWARRRDTAATSAGTEGDYTTIDTDALGRTWIRTGDPCSDHARITHAPISESTAAINEIVALNASDLIYVCSYKWVTTAANSLKWVRGTGTDCATGTTDIEGAQPYAANGGVAETGGGAPLFVVAAGNALCLSSSAATAHGGRVSYVRTAAP